MIFQTLYNPQTYTGETNDGTLFTVPNDAMSPKDILARFIRDMPVPETSTPTGTVNDNLDNDAFPMQGQEYDKLEMLDELNADKTSSAC